MSNISQFFAGNRKKNRRIIHGSVGLTTITWLVPPGISEVEVHCWGAGGSGAVSYGAGGGGYVTHVFPVTPSDRLLITAAASPGGTSSVSVPTQSPISPISATGGAAAPPTGGGAGGSGAYTIAPGISTARTFSASGGAGNFGGGAAGSPFGTGGSGANGGGGIGGAGSPTGGGGSLGAGSGNTGGLGINGYKTVVSFATSTSVVTENMSGGNGDNWFYVDEILGAGGSTNSIHGGAGGGGAHPGGNGGILGGGGNGGGIGGIGGGGGSGPASGGDGLVIIYW